ncbi:heparan sulfate glucosamine 3-O-sulfotransferase 6-like [Asterias amurensis]|uniref:heparan sulfate glucosamine 3-O-sulfotransferase 6-like n=1 Tax=Asterias amurensis TaxID=7602 RepID=UPI003AB7D1E6
MSTTTDSLQNVGWRFRRKALILAALGLIAFTAYSMSSFGDKASDAEVITTNSHNKAFQADGNGITGTVGTRLQKTQVRLAKPLDRQLVRAQSLEDSPTEEDLSSSSSSDGTEDYEEDEEKETPPLRLEGEQKRRLPKAIIIGVKKGGTRALLEFLRGNPQVVVSGKELHFFDRHFDRGMDWYRKAMPYSYPSQITMEKTPSYFVSDEAPARIKRSLGQDTKFLVVFRNPVLRAVSDHAQSLSKGKNTPFEEKAMLNYNSCKVDSRWSAIQIGLYAQYLENWLKYFPLKQFLFVNGENLVKTPGREMEKVQQFLQIRKTITEKSFVFNTTKGFPCLKVDGEKDVKCLGENKGRPHQRVDTRVLHCLKEFFRPHNEKFYKMTGINFHWDGETISKHARL